MKERKKGKQTDRQRERASERERERERGGAEGRGEGRNARQKKVDGTFSAARRRFVSAHNRKIMHPFFALMKKNLN